MPSAAALVFLMLGGFVVVAFSWWELSTFVKRCREKADRRAEADRELARIRARAEAILALPLGSFWDEPSQKWYIAFRGTHVVFSSSMLDLGLKCLGLGREKETT
jgi:hypothetical protein